MFILGCYLPTESRGLECKDCMHQTSLFSCTEPNSCIQYFYNLALTRLSQPLLSRTFSRFLVFLRQRGSTLTISLSLQIESRRPLVQAVQTTSHYTQMTRILSAYLPLLRSQQPQIMQNHPTFTLQATLVTLISLLAPPW